MPYNEKIAVQQTELNKKGANLKVDGISGPLTQKAIQDYGSLPPAASGASTAATDATANNLGTFRIALRSALSEAAATTTKNRMTQLSGLVNGGADPSVLSAAVGLAQLGLNKSQESVFSDLMSGYKDATEARQKEIDRINDLRAEYGSLVPASVTDLKTALNLIAPRVDKENKMKLEKMSNDQAVDNDVQSWAESFAKGEIPIGSVPMKIRSVVKVAADKIKTQLEADAKQEYKNKIALRLEKKISNFDTERGNVLSDENLTTSEQREVLDYIDSQEQSQKAAKSAGGKGIFSFLHSANDPTMPAGQKKISTMSGFVGH